MPGPALRAVTVAALVLAGASLAAPVAPAQSLSADLSFLFECPGNSRLAPDFLIEEFLHGEGFRVLNLAQARYAAKVRNFWDLDLIGLDGAHRWIDLRALPLEHGSYTARIVSRPPTHNDPRLERKLLDFVRHKLGCSERQIARRDNDAAAAGFFGRTLADMENDFREAKQIPASQYLEAKPSDAAIRRAIPGDWTIPRDSSDYDGRLALETFRQEGTYATVIYRDRLCGAAEKEVGAKWQVEGGVLVTILPSGKKLRDEVLYLGPERMVLHSLDDGTSYVREKTTACRV